MRLFFVLPIATATVAIGASGAFSDELDAAQTQDLLFRAPWAIQAGGAINYFVWDADGTLCVKQFEADEENCDDTGSWSIDGPQVCYSLEWWGKAVDLHELCFRVDAGASGEYKAKDENNLTALTFSVPAAE